jgi:UMF1 family MFS transporter
MHRVSSFGFAAGYIGGSTIPFVMAIVMIQAAPHFGFSMAQAIRGAVLLTVVWWGLFSIPFIVNVKQRYFVDDSERSDFASTLRMILRTAKAIGANRELRFFVPAYFCYIDGVDTVISMATAYGATLGLGRVSMILALLLTQIIAVPCSIIFSRLAETRGSLKMLRFAVFVYLLITGLGFVMGFGLERSWFGVARAAVLFWALAILVGTVQGGIQAVSRSHFAKLVPPAQSGEFFGFFDIFGKFASIIGPALYSLTKALSGSSAVAILSIAALFAAALILMNIKQPLLTIIKKRA